MASSFFMLLYVSRNPSLHPSCSGEIKLSEGDFIGIKKNKAISNEYHIGSVNFRACFKNIEITAHRLPETDRKTTM